MAPGLLLYRALGWLTAVLGIPYLLILRRQEWRERLGRSRSDRSKERIWIHAASLGEFEAARPLIDSWIERLGADRILVSCTNAVARDRLRERLPKGAKARLAPVDLWPIVGHVLDSENPCALIFVETEIWPEWIAAASARKIPVAVISARLSDRSFPRYRRLRRFIAPVLSRIDMIGCRTSRDRERWIAIGSSPERCEVWGNTKYDAGEPPDSKPAIEPDEAFLLVGGSMRSGEEGILDLLKPGMKKGLRLLLAVRHLRTLPAWERACLSRGLPCGRTSLLGIDPTKSGPSLVAELRCRESALPPVVFIDRMGLLQAFYRIGDAAFVGGTWAPVGGHNLFEPAREGTPVLFGPSIDGVRDAADQLLRTGGGRMVDGPSALLEVIEDLRTDGQRRDRMASGARKAAESLAGAVERSLVGLQRRAIIPESR